MANPSHLVKVYVRSDATTPGAPDEIAGINSVDFSPNIAMLDKTDFKDTTGAKRKLAGMTDGTATVSGPLDLSDSIQNLLRTQMFSGGDVYLTVHFNPSGSAGQKGYTVQCLAKGAKMSGQVEALNEFSCDLEFNGTPTAV